MSKRKSSPSSKPNRTDDEAFLFAGQEGIPSLFRYQKFRLTRHPPDRPCDCEILSDILKNHRIYCSNPLDFNDPWDCKPCLSLQALDDPKIRRETALFLIKNQRNGPRGDFMDRALLDSPLVLRRSIKAFTEYLVGFIAEHWAICCLSRDPCSILMWSYYADNHRGICLQFAASKTNFAAAMKVKYTDNYPTFLLSSRQFQNQMLLVKGGAWRHEQEYRMICPTSTDTAGAKESPLILKDDFLDIGPNALEAVIVGCQTSDDVIHAVRSLIKEHSSNVKVRRAVRASNKYTLQLEDI